MEKKELNKSNRLAWVMVFLNAVGGLSFLAGIIWARTALADNAPAPTEKKPRVVYPDKTKLDFEGAQIEGELRNPGEFYFQHKPEEKFNSLVKRRKNFHREMLRDVVLSK